MSGRLCLPRVTAVSTSLPIPAWSMNLPKLYETFERLCGNTVFVISVAVLVFGMFIASSYFAYQNSLNETEQSLKADMESQTKTIALSIEAYIDGKKETVQQMANFLLVQEFLDRARQDTLEQDPFFPHLCSLLLTVSGSDKNIAIAWLGSLRDEYSFSYDDISWEKNGWSTRARPWFSGTMEAENIYFSDPYWDFETGDVCVSLVKRVYAPPSSTLPSNEVVGFAGLDLFFPPIRDIMTEFANKNVRYPILISNDGSILYHPNKKYVFQHKLGFLDPALEQFTQSMSQAETATHLVSLNQGKNPVYFGYTPVKGTNWSIGIIWNKEDAEKTLVIFERTLIKSLLLNLLLFLIPLVFLGWMLIKRTKRFLHMKRLYDTVVNRMQTGVAVVDPNTDTILLTNPAYRHYLDMPPGQPIPFTSCHSLLGIADPAFQMSTQIEETKEVTLSLNGTNHYFSHYFASFQSFDNQKLFLSVLTDVTALTKMQTSLREARDAAEAASLAKSSFLANMSHEIRTPMNGIIGLADLLATSSLDSQQHQYIGLIRSSAEALLTVINDILDHSKIDAGKLLIEVYEFDLHRLIKELTFSFSHAAQQKSVEFQTVIAPDIPQFVHGDANRLRQVLGNFLSNAVKFTQPDGKVTFQVRMLSERGKSDWIYFSVSDTGIGFSEEQRNRLFTPFEQADNSTSRKFGGTGLGLTISKQLAELMGGRVDCQSELGTGSIFWCELPLPAVSSLQEQAAGSSSKIALKPLRILLVDDVKVNLIVLSSMLQQWGHITETAENGLQAIERLKTSQYDLVFMDCQMPEMDGYECTRQIRLPETAVLNSNIPIIAVTAHAMVGDKERCLASGMNDYIAKPINHRELKRMLTKWNNQLGEQENQSFS
jgi:signal transduction histidine kinase/ActR/RegA family two-component response regulator